MLPFFTASIWRWSLLLCCMLAGNAIASETGFVPPRPFLEGMELPPSPADPELYPGRRIWPRPALGHQPLIRYADEQRALSFTIPIPRTAEGQEELGWAPGAAASIGWLQGAERWSFTLPRMPPEEMISGLLPIPEAIRLHMLDLRLGETTHRLALRQVSAAAPWPLASLRQGYPIDEDGVPVVLVDRLREDVTQRLPENWFDLPPGRAEPVLLGDPLPAFGGDAWQGIGARRLITDDLRHPHHADAVALAELLRDDVPSLIVWSPGNRAVHRGTWSPEEDRLLNAIITRCAAIGQRPRLLLALPPLPVDASLYDLARERRHYLRERAFYLGWEVLDLAAEIPGPEIANRISEGAFARYPVGDHQAAMAIALHRAVVAPQEQTTCRLVAVPSIVYEGERWYLRFEQRGPVLSGALRVHDSDGRNRFFSLYDDDRGAVAHVPLDMQPGISVLRWWTATGSRELELRVADLRREYPIVGHVDGLPVDDQGRAVVLMAPRADERRLIKPEQRQVPQGEPLIFGDAPVISALQDRGYAATVVAGAALGHQDWQAEDPAVLVWAPGNQELLAGRWQPQEERLLGVLRYRRDHMAPTARLLLVLPSLPQDQALHERAHTRRELLRSTAFGQGWEVVDTDDAQRLIDVLEGDAVASDIAWQDLPVSVFPDDDARLVTLRQDRATLDGQAQVRWADGEWQPFDLHDDGHARLYLSLPTTVGRHRLEFYAGGQITSHQLHVAAQQGAWPIIAVRDGIPVDHQGAPVVLLATRHRSDDGRTWRLLRRRGARPDGPPLVVGALPEVDPSAWAAAGIRIANDVAQGCTSLNLIAALAQNFDPAPRSLAWLPGPDAIADGSWRGEEERLLAVVNDRFHSLGLAPRLLLLLPPLPEQGGLRDLARRRRRRLRSQALAHNWSVIDLDGFTGDLIRLLRARLR